MLQYSELELLNRPFINFIHPSDHESTMARFYKILEGEATVYFECRFLTRSGKIKWLAWTTTPPSEEGLIFCVAKDITEKKELEKLLNKANNLARIGGWEIDLLKGTIYWSDITREIHEAEADFVPNLETGISFYKEGISRDYITQKIKDAIETGNSWDVELQIVTAKGHDKWVRAIGEAEMADNRCVRIYGSFQDIDVRKRAEISVTEVLEERNIILESIGDAFFAVDRNWTVNYWNNMAEKVLGIPKEAMLNRNLWEVFSDSVDSESYKMYHQAIERNEAGHFEDYYPPLKKWYEISAYPSDTGLSVYFKDITDRKTSDTRLRELNESLQQQTKELASSNAELEQFAYVASHDLQEPLRMVTGFLTQIERKYGEVLDDKGKQYINFAVDGAKRMRQIILDLLEFSRVGTIEDNLENIGLDKLVSDITALYRKQIEEKKAVILFDGVPIIQTYKTPLRQVLQNLVGNSLKYSRSGADPVLRISCSETASHWQISVKDNGIGIEPEYFDKIFIIFQRLHNKNEYSGTGMGLAIAKKIIENLGGTIWVKSEIDQGATFYFTILKPKI
jgi:PAS domain S-box-containing protein